ERVPRVQERLLPARNRRVVADDAVAEAGGARAGLPQARHLERDVVDAGPARGQEAMQEAIVAAWLEDLDAAAAVELPLAEPEHVRGHSEVGDATQHAHEVGRRVGDTLGGDGDVVELDPGHWRRSVRYRTMKTRLGIIGAAAGAHRTLGCVITIGAGMYEPGVAMRTDSGRLGFKVGEHDGRDTERARRIAELLTAVAGAKVTTNLWGERWSKLAVNCML